jgi:hypothetical protein
MFEICCNIVPLNKLLMLNRIQNIFSKKKEKHPEISEFLLNRPIYRTTLSEYYSNRFDGNEFYRLNIDTGLILFLDLTNNSEFENYINDNYIALKEDMSSKNRTFVKNISSLEFPSNLNVSYYFPFIKAVVPATVKRDIDNQILLDFIGYTGDIKTGFLSFNSSGITFLGLKENENIDKFISQYINNLPVDTEERIVLYSDETGNNAEPNIEIDGETKLLLNQIEENIIKLKKSGQFFLVAPKLEQLVQHFLELDVSISNIVIDKDFNITLPLYQNREIILSHLTKAVYILFLNHPEGIFLNELGRYENELLSIYKTISYQISLDKMKNSVHELIVSDKAIFVHFSRIKSAFVKNFTDFYAVNYYIQGEKGGRKYIKLPKEKISFLQ